MVLVAVDVAVVVAAAVVAATVVVVVVTATVVAAIGIAAVPVAVTPGCVGERGRPQQQHERKKNARHLRGPPPLRRPSKYTTPPAALDTIHCLFISQPR